MTTKTELRRQWAVFTNGLVHAMLTGAVTGSAALMAWWMDEIDPKTAWIAVGSAVVSGVVGFLRQSPLPDILATEETTETVTVTKTVETNIPEVQDNANLAQEPTQEDR